MLGIGALQTLFVVPKREPATLLGGFLSLGANTYVDLEHNKRGRNLLCSRHVALNNGFPLASTKRIALHSTKVNDGIDHIVPGLFAVNGKLRCFEPPCLGLGTSQTIFNVHWTTFILTTLEITITMAI